MFELWRVYGIYKYYTTNSIKPFVAIWFIKFMRIDTSSLINIKKTLNKPISKFYNSDAVNVVVADGCLCSSMEL